MSLIDREAARAILAEVHYVPALMMKPEAAPQLIEWLLDDLEDCLLPDQGRLHP